MVCHRTLPQPLQIAFYNPVTAKRTNERILTDLPRFETNVSTQFCELWEVIQKNAQNDFTSGNVNMTMTVT